MKKEDIRVTEKKVMIETTQYIAKCKNCGKVVVGSTESQVKFNMSVHMIGKGCNNGKS